jgi:hypothetical protein
MVQHTGYRKRLIYHNSTHPSIINAKGENLPR